MAVIHHAGADESFERRHGDPAALAAEAIVLTRADTDRAFALAREALGEAEAAGDARAESIAERAMGLVARERNQIERSAEHLRRAVVVAERGGFPSVAAEARMSLVGTLVAQGDLRAALREADRAAAALTGVELARLEVQRASVLFTQGRLAEALEGFQRALPRLRRAGDKLWLARLHNNRGLLHLQRGALAAAEADHRRAEELSAELGQHRSVAHARQNLGLVASRRGDVAAALAAFDQVQAYFDSAGITDGCFLDMRCLTLLGARLVAEARSSAVTAVETLSNEHRSGYAAMAQLRLAEAALLDGDPQSAREAAEEARRAFMHQNRPAFAARARGLALRAAWMSGERTAALLRSAQSTAKALGDAGFAVEALDAEILVVRLALDLGRRELARKTLNGARACRTRGPVQLRSRAWHAEALLRLADGDRRGADAALRAGINVIERYRATLGATELRAEASGHATELAQLGLRLALEDGRPERVLTWAERAKAGSMRLRPLRPPDDAQLADDLAKLRTVVNELEGPVPAAVRARLMAHQSKLEEAVRSRSRHAGGLLGASLARPPSIPSLLEALGRRVLVEVICHDGRLYAVVAADRRLRLHGLGAESAIAAELEELRFALRRAARVDASSASLAAAVQAAEFGARRLDDMLLAPLADDIGDRPLVVVPTSVLHALPWSLLPSCQGRPVTVAPSAAMWHRATTTPSRSDGGTRVFIAGPRLDHADGEVLMLAGTYDDAHVLRGPDATCAAVCGALAAADLAHVASHGRFRADNPLFSSLEVAGGHLTVYDLEGLEGVPHTLVLSSCDSGLSEVRPGDELMGLAAALLAMGTHSLVASVVPVPDAATRSLMLAFHAELRGGATASEALAAAQCECRLAGPQALVACAGFVAFGGDSPPAEAVGGRARPVR